MGAEADVAVAGASDGFGHRFFVAIVTTAGNIRGRHHRPDFVLARCALGEICTEIDHRGPPLPFPSPQPSPGGRGSTTSREPSPGGRGWRGAPGEGLTAQLLSSPEETTPARRPLRRKAHRRRLLIPTRGAPLPLRS